MAEKSILSIVELLLYLFGWAFCAATVISTAVVLSTVADTTLFGDAEVDTEFEEDREIFRAVAGWTLTVALIGAIVLSICTIIRFLFYFEIFIHHFSLFGAVGITLNFILFIMLIGGGIPLATNADDSQVEYLDRYRCSEDSRSVSQDICDDLAQLRNSQIASSVLAFLGAITSGVLIGVTWVGIKTRNY